MPELKKGGLNITPKHNVTQGKYKLLLRQVIKLNHKSSNITCIGSTKYTFIETQKYNFG